MALKLVRAIVEEANLSAGHVRVAHVRNAIVFRPHKLKVENRGLKGWAIEAPIELPRLIVYGVLTVTTGALEHVESSTVLEV